MTSPATDKQFDFGAPKVGASIEVQRNPHLDHLLTLTDEAVALIERHLQDVPSIPVAEVAKPEKVDGPTGIDTATARDNVYQLFDKEADPHDYDNFEAA
jgi:hypothetical protein